VALISIVTTNNDLLYVTFNIVFIFTVSFFTETFVKKLLKLL